MPLTIPSTDYNNYPAQSLPSTGYDDGQYHLAPRYAMFDFIKLFILCVDRSKFASICEIVFVVGLLVCKRVAVIL